MKLYRNEIGWAERLVATATPSVTLRSAVPPHLSRVPFARELAKIRLRALLHWKQTPDWLALLNSHPAFSEYLRNYPKFLYKVYRPYVSHALTPGQRLETISAHYAFMFRRGLGQTIARASLGPVVLAEVAGKSGLPYQVHLRTVNMFEREGDLALQLVQDGKVLYTVAFAVAPRDGVPAISVGCIQGGRTEDAREAIRTATRDLHGIRPKQLMASLVQQLGHDYGCKRMVMVSNRNRVIYKALRLGCVLADYDQLWNELGARKRVDGDFELDCVPVGAPDLEQIASKKRSEAKKRYELVRAMALQVSVSLRAREAAAP
ncbi:DUF535 family protein [Massilia sp. 9096]|uniref:VirK/YbjX family protein n=1 Tax=Massilia sp. 9096 TaxID=1500894 RepID=UPI00068E852D|nr:DUF535 family protein [Massilia sp. 9096]